jgi:hypothetical protein
MDVLAKSDSDRFRVTCAVCGVETKNVFATDYAFTATCPSCGQTASLRFDPLRWHGLPATPAV